MVPMHLPNLPVAWKGRRIVQISDLHVGRRVRDEFLIEWFEKIKSMQPDLIVITGDFMTCLADEQVDHVARVLDHLKPGRFPTLAITGNHDYGHTWVNYQVADKLSKALGNVGIKMLRNQVVRLDGLPIIGIDDLWSPDYQPFRAISKLGSDEHAIALCHNPDAQDYPEWSTFKGWVLAGHTHGGQCKFPFLGAPIIPVRNRQYVAGIYNLGQDRTLYINRGLGFSKRIRFNARPEITIFTLV